MTPDELNNIAVEYEKQNPSVSREDIAQYVAKNRVAGREKLEKFLTAEQLTKLDAEIAKAKDFLSQRAAFALENRRGLPRSKKAPWYRSSIYSVRMDTFRGQLFPIVALPCAILGC